MQLTASIPMDVPAAPSPFHLSPFALARSVGGFAALGLAAAVAGQPEALASAPAGLETAAGVMLLTGPALVVGHQYLRLKASPAALLGALADAFTRGGAVALGAAPAVLWLGVTSDMGPTIGLITLLGVGSFAILRAIGNLFDAEAAGGGTTAGIFAIALGWAGLAALVALRLLLTFHA